MVASESCPIPSLITLIGIPFALAADAQLCRATYSVKGIVTPIIFGVLVISGAKIAVTTVKINLLRWFKSFEEV